LYNSFKKGKERKCGEIKDETRYSSKFWLGNLKGTDHMNHTYEYVQGPAGELNHFRFPYQTQYIYIYIYIYIYTYTYTKKQISVPFPIMIK
jgi:hypothetical protein